MAKYVLKILSICLKHNLFIFFFESVENDSVQITPPPNFPHFFSRSAVSDPSSLFFWWIWIPEQPPRQPPSLVPRISQWPP